MVICCLLGWWCVRHIHLLQHIQDTHFYSAQVDSGIPVLTSTTTLYHESRTIEFMSSIVFPAMESKAD